MDDCIIRATSASSAHGSGAWLLVGWRRDPLTCRQLQIRDGDTSKLRDKGILRTVLNIIDVIAYKLLGMDVWEQTSTGRGDQDRAVRTRTTTPWQRARLRMRMTLQRQSQSFALTTASENRDELCGPSNLVVGGQSCVLVMDVMVPTVVGVSVEDTVTFTLSCSETFTSTRTSSAGRKF